jgi:hypothetical protein
MLWPGSAAVLLLVKCKARKAVVGTTIPLLLLDRAGAGAAFRGYVLLLVLGLLDAALRSDLDARSLAVLLPDLAFEP